MPKVKLEAPPLVMSANDSSWLSLKELRELVRKADEAGWADSSLVSHTGGGSEHPRLRNMRCARHLIVEGYDA